MSDGVVDTLHKVVLNCRSFVCTVNLIQYVTFLASFPLYCVLSFMICSPNTNVTNNDKTDCCVDIRYRWCSPIDNKMYPTPQGLSLTFEQFDKLKDVARVLLDLIPDLNTTLPCYMSHQNVEEAIYCGECNPNGPDFD
jgi:hypothetical protein